MTVYGNTINNYPAVIPTSSPGRHVLPRVDDDLTTNAGLNALEIVPQQ